MDRPNLSKDYLAGNAPEEWIPLRDAAFYREMNIDFSVGDGAASIDTAGRVVTLKSGKKLNYGALLLATGAEPRRLPIPGADGDNVHVLRTLADSRAIIAKAGEGARAVVIGSSFIGLEVAASLRARKVEVDVVSTDKVPLARVVGEAIGGFVRKLHEEHGVRFHLGAAPQGDHRARRRARRWNHAARRISWCSASALHRARQLAEAAGLRVERGIVGRRALPRERR